MADHSPITVTPTPIDLDSHEFEALSAWPFADAFVGRLLQNDIPQRMLFGDGRIWMYRDPGGRLVGFDTIDVCDEYCEYTAGRRHPYIPLLAVNPTIKSLGYGTTIVQHLIDEAALLAYSGACHDVVFLDVYTTNAQAIKVYTKCGFVSLTDEPIPDPQEGGKPYIVMARRVSISTA